MKEADPVAAPLLAHLARARRDRRISQAALADKLGVTQTALSYWEAGKRDVSLTDFLRWAAALDIRIATEDTPEAAPKGSPVCPNCERCTWNPGPDCGIAEHPHCPRCGHCCGRHV